MEDRSDVVCPHCGEEIAIWVDPGGGNQEFIEDCFVCCRPIRIRVAVDPEGVAAVDARFP